MNNLFKSIGDFLYAVVNLLINMVSGIAQMLVMIPSALTMLSNSESNKYSRHISTIGSMMLSGSSSHLRISILTASLHTFSFRRMVHML